MSWTVAVVGFVNSLLSLGTDPSYVTRSWSYSLTVVLGDFWDTWTGSAALDEHLSTERDETRYCFANEPSQTVSFTAHLSARGNALCSHAQTQLSSSLVERERLYPGIPLLQRNAPCKDVHTEDYNANSAGDIHLPRDFYTWLEFILLLSLFFSPLSEFS